MDDLSSGLPTVVDDPVSMDTDCRESAHGWRPDIARRSVDTPVTINAGIVTHDWPTRPNHCVGAAEHPCETAPDQIKTACDAQVLIVDDCALHRECLVGVLSARPGAGAPGIAWDLSSMIAGIDATLPQVVLLNIATDNSGMLLRHAMKLSKNVRVVVTGVSEEDESGIVECAEAGAAGFHLRTESLAELIVAIDKVSAGESLCSQKVSTILLNRLSALASQREPEAKELVLTSREVQILRMLEMGLANREIADQLCIAVHTVKNHVHSLLTKLGVATRAQAAALARNLLAAEQPAAN